MIKNFHYTQLLRAPARQYGGEGDKAALFAPLGRKLFGASGRYPCTYSNDSLAHFLNSSYYFLNSPVF